MSGLVDRLNSWKEIAAHVGRDIRTVMRWEKERGLPVRRLPGKGVRQPVFAYTHELNEWLRRGGNGVELATEETASIAAHEFPPTPVSPIIATPPKRGYRFWHIVIAASVGAAVTLCVTLAFSPRKSIAASTSAIQFTTNGVQAIDGRGRTIWTHHFQKRIHPEALKHGDELNKLVRFVDFYGDGHQEILVTVPLERSANPADPAFAEIDCFSDSGKLLWSYLPQERFRFGSYDIEAPWIVEDVFISEGPKPTIWAALAHYRWGNSFVVQLDPQTGSATVRFVNTGIIYKLNETRIGGKSYLLIGGFNNEYSAGVLAALDEYKPYAVSPQTAGTRHKCLTCPEGSPDYYFVFPRSEINRLHNAWEDSVRFVNVQGSTIEVEKAELGDPALGDKADIGKVHVVYDFHTEPTIQPFAFRFDSWYDLMHRNLQENGKLDHDIDSCPERQNPQPVRTWTPNAGWTETAFPSLNAAN